MKFCPKCGTNTEGMDFCSKCGADLRNENENQVESINEEGALPVKQKISRTKLLIILVIAAVVIVGIIITAISVYNNNIEKQKKAAEKAYYDNLVTVSAEMLTSGAEAESLCNLTTKVWYNAIYSESDKETDKYTKGAKDFNEALLNLHSDKSIVEKIDSITEAQDSVDDLMGKLKDPPEKYAKEYDVLLDLYTTYNSFTSMATNPTGSYNDYSTEVRSADDEFMTKYDKLSVLIL